MNKSLDTKKEVLEVKVKLVDTPEIENFNKEKSIVTFDITNEVPLEMKSNVMKLVSESTKEQLEQIAPFIQKVFSLQEIFFTSYNPEKKEESIAKYKELKKIVSAKAIDEAFEPMYREVMNRKEEIVNMKKAFKEDLKNKLLLLDENFSEYIEEEKKKKAAAEEKKNKEANEMKEKLAKAEALNNKQEIDKAIITCQNKISQINIAVTSGLANLSLEGLKNQKTTISSYTFDQFKPTNEGIEEERLNELKEFFNSTLKSSINIIDTKINELNLQQENNAIKNENNILNAQSPNSLDSQQPQGNFQEQPIQQNPVINQQTSNPNLQQSSYPINTPSDDYNKMILLKSMFENYTKTIKDINEKFIADVAVITKDMKQEVLKTFLNGFLEKSAPEISKWMDKTLPWFMKGYNKFEEFIKSNQK